jgi:exosortase E/protease (VPEID-CTERM system)
VHTETTPRLDRLPTPPSPARRGIGLLGLLGLELFALTLRFDTHGLMGAAPWWAVWLGFAPAGLSIGLASVAAFLVLVGPRLPTLWQALHPPGRHHRWGRWLAGHGVACGVFTLMTAALLDVEPAAVRPSLLWPMAWVLSGATVLLLWLGTLAPPSGWWHVVQQEYAAVLGASLVGVGAWGSGQLGQALWAPLAELTLWVVRALLGLVYPEISSDLPARVVGTPTFQVTIAPECSGYEGIGCVTLLLTLYLWWFRTHLRFPHALLLLPMGMLAAWVMNALRLTTLIALGTSVSPAVAQGGFHAQAGWIAFLLVGLGLIAMTRRCPLWTIATPAASAPAPAQYATALLLPLLVLMATTVVTSALSSGVDWWYPVRVVTTSVALWSCRQVYRSLTWTWSWHAIILGMVVFGVWLGLEPADHHRSTVMAASLATLPGGLSLVWIGFRVIGSVLIVPIAEELAFRGYVLPKLVAPDVVTVRPGQCTWWACLVSSILFGILHGRWLAGTLAGIGYALALRQRGQLADAVVAHMTTNALIAAYVLSHHAWVLWM